MFSILLRFLYGWLAYPIRFISNHPKINHEPDSLNAKTPLIAIVFHSFYTEPTEVFFRMVAKLNGINSILVTVHQKAPSFQTVSKQALIDPRVHIHYVDSNLGRDVLPFLDLIKSGALDGFDVVIKLHSKASQAAWFNSLLDTFIGSQRTLKRIIRKTNLRCKPVLVSHPWFSYPISRFSSQDIPLQVNVISLLSLLSVSNPGFAKQISWFFPAGTMFSANSKAISIWKKAIMKLNLVDFFTSEPLSNSQGFPHAFERFFGASILFCGGEFKMTSLVDLLRLDAIRTKMI